MMKTLILILLASILISSAPIKQSRMGGCLQMDIMLLGDLSSSVEGYEPFVAHAFISFVNQFELSETGIKIGVITFNSSPNLISPLSSDTGVVRRKTRTLLHRAGSGSTNMLGALAMAIDQFTRNGRTDYKKMIILISDGEPDAEEDVLETAKQIKSLNIGICGVLIIVEEDRDTPFKSTVYPYGTFGIPIVKRDGRVTMKKISSDFCYVESNYENLIIELKKLDICM